MNRTKIEWVLNPDGTQGYTWNPITGCLNGCEYCYARKLANGRLRTRYLANTNITTADISVAIHPLDVVRRANDPFYPRFWPDRLEELIGWIKGLTIFEAYHGLKTPKAKGIFVCDMSDLFGIGIPETWTKQVMDVIEANPQHRFYLLTKQPQNLIKFSPFPDNCWVGVTVTCKDDFWRAFQGLGQIEAKVKYLSFEPLLGSIWDGIDATLIVDWVIIGAQTKPYKPPKLEEVEEIIWACCKANIPVFIKDNLGFIIPGYKKGDKLRQELPV